MHFYIMITYVTIYIIEIHATYCTIISFSMQA